MSGTSSLHGERVRVRTEAEARAVVLWHTLALACKQSELKLRDHRKGSQSYLEKVDYFYLAFWLHFSQTLMLQTLSVPNQTEAQFTGTKPYSVMLVHTGPVEGERKSQ